MIRPDGRNNINFDDIHSAEIDSEDKGSGAFNGKTLPMTSKHNISASAIYTLNDKANMTLTQKYRSKGYAADDFSNTFTQRQMAYNSTDFNFVML